MGYKTIHKNFLFIEGDFAKARQLGQVSSDLGFKFGAQLKNLDNVKDELMIKAKALGGNVVINFTYGQKSKWLAIDDVAFRGMGIAAIISEEDIAKIKEEIENR